MSRPRRHSAPLLFALAGLWLAARGASAQQPLFSFAQISDSQPRSSTDNQRFVEGLRTIAESGEPGALLPQAVEFVLFAGDITYGNTRSEWIAATDKLDAWLTANDIPYLAVPGNHDVNPDRTSRADTSLYSEFIASPAVWSAGGGTISGQNGPSRTLGWSGLRFIGFDSDNPGWNAMSSADVAAVASQVGAADAAGENVFLLTHHPHNEGGHTPLASVLTNRSIVGYLHGHINSPSVKKGLSGISNPNVWDVNTNALYINRDLVYYEVFPTELHAHLVLLGNSTTRLPPAIVIPLAHPLTSSGSNSAPGAAFSAAPLTGNAPLSVSFTNQSSGATSFLWDFGDGTSSSAASPTHVYLAAGTYSVSLEASNAFGTTLASRADLISVTTSAPPPPENTFLPVADARVNESNASSNYGADPVLRVRQASGGSYHTYLRFDLTTLTGPVVSARLRLFSSDGSDVAGRVFATSGSWSENTITWANKPGASGALITSSGAVATGAWAEFDVKAVVSGPRVLDLVLQSSSSNSCYYSSREGAHPPELVVTTGSQ